MATAGWRGARPLSEVLRAEPQRFDALQAVRLLEAAAAESGAAAVRFRGSLGSAFPASEINRLDPPAQPGAPVELTVSFMTLAGGFGPLPRPLAELVSARAPRKDMAPRDFLDNFNHRLVALLIQLRRLPRPAAEPVVPEATRLAGWLFALLGLATPGLRRTLTSPPGERLDRLDRGLPILAGLLARRPLSLHALERLLAHHFGLRIRVEPLQGRWLALDPDQTTVLGRAGRNRALGRDAVVGLRVWDQAAGLRVILGPLARKTLESFLPGARAWAALRTLLAFALDGVFEVELVLRPCPGSAGPLRLSRGGRARLGWTSWLGGARQDRQPAPVRLRVGRGAIA
jgi:type VI secretion system protein ImpH